MSSAFPDPREPRQFDDDVMHGLMAAHASETVGTTVARVEPRRSRSMQPMSMGPIAAILLMAVTLAVLVPLAISPSAANASDVIGSAEAALAEPGSRTYEIRITRWGGPVASRLMQGEITHVAGSEPRSFGYLELDDSGKRMEFGLDAQGAHSPGSINDIRAPPIGKSLHPPSGQYPSPIQPFGRGYRWRQLAPDPFQPLPPPRP